MTGIYRRFAHLIHEVAKFGAIGIIGAIIAFGLSNILHRSNLLHHGAGMGPLTAFAIGTVVATLFSYYANRYWTFRHRDSAGAGREYVLFFALSAVGLAITELIVGFTYYALDLRGLVAYNIAMVIGTAVGTLFRFWSYKKWVFLTPATPATPAVPAALGTPATAEPADPALRPEPVSF
jgi:putative flippase GtrA